MGLSNSFVLDTYNNIPVEHDDYLEKDQRVNDLAEQLAEYINNKGFSKHKCQLDVGNSTNETTYNNFALKKGYKEHNSLYFMRRPIILTRDYLNKVTDSPITFREFFLDTQEANEQYLRELEWKCYTDDVMDMKSLLGYMDSDFFMVYGIFDGDKLVGAVMVEQDGEDIPEIISVSVLEQYRRRNYANLMIEEVMGLLSQKGFEQVKLTVFTNNEPAIGLYRSLGFNIDKEEKRFVKYI